MGSELSSQRNGRNKVSKSHLAGHLRKGKKVSQPSPEENECSRNGSTSPGPSVCSDSDLPYISYTVNRPIGGNIIFHLTNKFSFFTRVNFLKFRFFFVTDSPKISSKQLALQRGKSLGSAGNSPARRKLNNSRKVSDLIGKGGTGHDIVVVKPAKEPESQDKDPFLLKLQSIPLFLPIMRGTLNLPGK